MAGIEGFPGFISDIIRGGTKDFAISVKRLGEPIPITGSKFYVTFATDQDPDTEPDLEIIIDPPTDPDNGKTVGTVEADESMLLEPGPYFYSVRYVSAAGKPYVVDMGKIKVVNSVSSRLT